jgi:hypothetical protein
MNELLKHCIYTCFAQHGQMGSVDDILYVVEKWASHKHYGDRVCEKSWPLFLIKKLHSILD